MSEWNQEYQDEVEWLDLYFQLAYPAWAESKIDFTKRRPDSLDRLHKAVSELALALSEFTLEVAQINEE